MATKSTLVNEMPKARSKMIVSSERLEMFRDLKIRKSEISENADLFNSKSDTGQAIQISPNHIIKLLEYFNSRYISKEHLLEWVNIIWFTDLFEYSNEFSDCIASVMNELEEVDEAGKELNDEKIALYINALTSNVEL